MAQNKKQTSANIAKKASSVLGNKKSSATAKSLAGSALSQSKTRKQTGSNLESKASDVLRSSKYNATTKELAASILSQSNKNR